MLFQKTEDEGLQPNFFPPLEANITLIPRTDKYIQNEKEEDKKREERG